MLPLEYRTMATTTVLFKTDNIKEKNAIYDELFQSQFSRKQFNEIEKFVYNKPYQFMLINDNGLYKNFDKIIIN